MLRATVLALVLASSCSAQVLDGVARRHASLFEARAGLSSERWYFSAELLDAHAVLVPAWVASLAVESRVVRCGRWTAWLADRPESVTDSVAVYRIVRTTGRLNRGR